MGLQFSTLLQAVIGPLKRPNPPPSGTFWKQNLWAANTWKENLWAAARPTGGGGGGSGGFLLTESGDFVLTEDGDKVILE